MKTNMVEHHFFTLLLAAMTFFASANACAEVHNLTATPNTLFVRTDAPLKFIVHIDAEPGLIRTGVRLLKRKNGAYSPVGTMHDDGQNGDALANDNDFTLVLPVIAGNAPNQMDFRASVAYEGSAKRTQSSTLTIDVIVPVHLSLFPSAKEITLYSGSWHSSLQFFVELGNQGAGPATIYLSRTTSPSAGLASWNAFGDTLTSSDKHAVFPVDMKLSSETVGDYTVTIKGTVITADGTAEAEAVLTVHVLPNDDEKLALVVGPDGITSGTSATVSFIAQSESLGLVQRVTLLEVDAKGTVLKDYGAMRSENDPDEPYAFRKLFKAEHTIAASAPGTARHFKAIADLGYTDTIESPLTSLPSLPYPIGFGGTNPAAVISEPDSGAKLLCNQLLLGFKPDTPMHVIDGVIASIGGQVIGVEPAINTYQVGMACKTYDDIKTMLEMLQKHPSIDSAGPNGISALAQVTPSDPLYSSQYTPKLVRAEEAWLIARGKRAIVAILDSGVDPSHPDLKGGLILGHDYINNDGEPFDDHMHGTHVAGIVGARGNNNVGIAGVAWEAQMLVIKVCGGQLGVPGVGLVGGCPDSALTSGILEAAKSARIINLSISGTVSELETLMNRLGMKSALNKAIDAVYQSGVLLIAAAGNDNSNRINVPCNYTRVLCVGNTDANDLRHVGAHGSNFGAHVGIAAPGTLIRSTVPTFADPSGYEVLTGTSMASPMIAGVASLIRANFPAWSNAMIAERLVKTAVPIDQQVGPRVDAFDAVFNGSFEHDLTGWDGRNGVGIAQKLGSSNPTKGKKMALVKLVRGDVTTDLSQRLVVEPGVTKLTVSFDYAVLTEETPERPDYHNNTSFKIYLGANYNGMLVSKELSELTLSPFNGVHFSTNGPVRWTKWRHFRKTIPVVAGVAYFTIRIDNACSVEFETAILIDNIRFR